MGAALSRQAGRELQAPHPQIQWLWALALHAYLYFELSPECRVVPAWAASVQVEVELEARIFQQSCAGTTRRASHHLRRYTLQYTIQHPPLQLL